MGQEVGSLVFLLTAFWDMSLVATTHAPLRKSPSAANSSQGKQNTFSTTITHVALTGPIDSARRVCLIVFVGGL